MKRITTALLLLGLAAACLAAPALARHHHRPYCKEDLNPHRQKAHPMPSIKLTNQKMVTALYATLPGGLSRSIDGGMSWQARGSYSYMGLWFITPDVGLVSGDGLYRTDDGGRTQYQVISGAAGSFMSIGMHDALRGYAVGNNAQLYTTADGGITWTSRGGAGLGIGATNLLSVYAVPGTSQIAYVGGNVNEGDAVILKTTDAGASWTLQTSGEASIGIMGITCNADGQHAVANRRYTTDGGTTWSACSSAPASDLGGHKVIATDIFIAARLSTGTLYRSLDGGAKWTLTAAPGVFSYQPYEPIVVSGPQIWAAGSSGVVYSSDRGASWVGLSTPGIAYAITAVTGRLSTGPALVLECE